MKVGNRRIAHLASGEGQTLQVLGELNTFKARYAAYTLLESTALPGASGLPPHVHHDQDEAIYVLEGEYVLFVSGDEELSSLVVRSRPSPGEPSMPSRSQEATRGGAL